MIQLEVTSIWKSYTRTAEWRIIWNKIIAVTDASFAVAKRRPEMNFFRFSFRSCKSSVSNCDDLLSTLSCNYWACLETSSRYQTTYSDPPENLKYRVMQQLLRQSYFFCFHFITYKNTYAIEKNVLLTLMMRLADECSVAL